VRLEITFSTQYAYDPPTGSGLTALRMTPGARPGQNVLSAELHTEPGKRALSYTDGWGTHVDLIEATAHAEARFTMRAVVDTGREDIDTLLPDALAVLFTRDSARVRREAVSPLLQQLGLEPQGWASVETLVTCLRQWFTYRLGVTDATTELETVLATAEGVCQDLAHVCLAALRSWGWCARYVSGYVYTNGAAEGRIEAEAMHAWVEVYRPGIGWFGLDPTHGAYVDDRYVVVAIGRDYDDVRPVRGLVAGVTRQRQSTQLLIKHPGAQ
jgi:transglutaminase-like putative cysteine protease